MENDDEPEDDDQDFMDEDEDNVQDLMDEEDPNTDDAIDQGFMADRSLSAAD